MRGRWLFHLKIVNYVERHTLDQADDELWIVERRKRITASKVGSISKMRQTTKRSKKVEVILYSNFRGNVATRYSTPIQNLHDTEWPFEFEYEVCGLFVSLENPWLAASPDGLVYI